MIKTGSEIENDVIGLLNDSSLKEAVAGIYADGMRPVVSGAQEAVVSFVSGTNGQIQSGMIDVNVYVPDTDAGSGRPVKNRVSCARLEKRLAEVAGRLGMAGYEFSAGDTIRTVRAETGNEHYVNLRLNFKRTTF